MLERTHIIIKTWSQINSFCTLKKILSPLSLQLPLLHALDNIDWKDHWYLQLLKNGLKQLQLFLWSKTPWFNLKAKVFKLLKKFHSSLQSQASSVRKSPLPLGYEWKGSKNEINWLEDGHSQRKPGEAHERQPDSWSEGMEGQAQRCSKLLLLGACHGHILQLHQFSALISFHCLIKLITQATESSQAVPAWVCLQQSYVLGTSSL